MRKVVKSRTLKEILEENSKLRQQNKKLRRKIAGLEAYSNLADLAFDTILAVYE